MYKEKRDLGANHQGRSEYIALGYTQIILVFLSLWFLYFAITNIGLDYVVIISRISDSVINVSLLLSFVLVALFHFNIVLKAIIDDYVHGHLANYFSKLFLVLFLAAMAVLTIVSMVYIVIV